MILGTRVRTRLLTHFHFISFLKNSESGGVSLGKWVADLGKWVAGYELSMRRDDHVETMDRQDRGNRLIKFLDDRDDHMETRLNRLIGA